MLHSNIISFISVAQSVVAQAGGEGGGAAGGLGAMGSLLPLGLMFVVFYFLLIRPASKQRKEHAQLLDALKKGDEVATSGGIYGRILAIDDKIVSLEIADKVKIRILRDRIAGRWQGGSSDKK